MCCAFGFGFIIVRDEANDGWPDQWSEPPSRFSAPDRAAVGPCPCNASPLSAAVPARAVRRLPDLFPTVSASCCAAAHRRQAGPARHGFVGNVGARRGIHFQLGRRRRQSGHAPLPDGLACARHSVPRRLERTRGPLWPGIKDFPRTGIRTELQTPHPTTRRRRPATR